MPTPAWVTPPNPAPGGVIVAAHTDDLATDALYLKDRVDNPPRAIVYHNAAQSIANAADTLLAFNSEYGDSAALHDPVTTNSRLTAPTGETGYYLVSAYVEFAANATGIRALWIRANASFVVAEARLSAAPTGVTRLAVAGITTLSAGQFVDLVVHQTSGGALNVAASFNLFSMVRIA